MSEPRNRSFRFAVIAAVGLVVVLAGALATTLLRQDDVVVIDDLLGLSYNRWGAEEIYDRARREGKTDLALLAAVVAGEGAPQKYLTAAGQTDLEVAS